MNLLNLVNPLKWFGKTAKDVSEAVVNVKSAWSGNQGLREQYAYTQENNAHLKDMAVMAAYTQELIPRNNRTKWESFIDGINKSIRPFIVITIIVYFFLAVINPNLFQQINITLDSVKPPMWWAAGCIITFYFANYTWRVKVL